jgi:hypothetical protein
MSAFIPIEGALGAVKTGFDLIKGARELLKKDKVSPTEVSSQLLELQELLLETRSSLIEADDYIANLEAKLATKEDLEKLEKLLTFNQSVYWKRTGEANEVEPDPYCTVCWEKGRVLSHLRPGATRGTYTCQIDGSSYYTNNYRDDPMPVLQRARRR